MTETTDGSGRGGTIRAIGNIDQVFVLDGIERFSCDRDRALVPRNRQLVLRGWTIDPALDRIGRPPVLEIDGVPLGTVRYARQRHDVAGHLANAAFERAGFLATVRAGSLSIGSHEARIVFAQSGAALDPIRFDVVAEARSRIANERATNATVRVASLSAPFGRDARAFHVELGLPAVARGTIEFLDARSQVAEYYTVIDELEAFPVLVSGTGLERPFLACFPTDDLHLGDHTFARRRARSRRSCTRMVAAVFVRRRSALRRRLRRATVRNERSRIARLGRRVARKRTRFRTTSSARARGRHLRARLGRRRRRARDAASRAFVEFGNGTRVALEMRGYRPDVATALGMPRAAFCGIAGSISADVFPPGTYVGRCFVVSKDGANVYPSDATIEFVVGA